MYSSFREKFPTLTTDEVRKKLVRHPHFIVLVDSEQINDSHLRIIAENHSADSSYLIFRTLRKQNVHIPDDVIQLVLDRVKKGYSNTHIMNLRS